MALIDVGRWLASLTFEDNNAKKATMSLFLAGTVDYDGAAAFLTALRDAVLPLTNAKLISGTVSRQFSEDSLVVPPKESEVERKLVLPFTTLIPGHGTTVEIPSHVFTIEQDGTDIPILTTAALVALQNLIVNGGIGFENGVVTVANVQIDKAGTAYSAHRTRKPNRA